MAPLAVPDFLRIILLLLSILSFLPNIHFIISRNNSSGISLLYILFNLISTTEQLTIAFLYTVTAGNHSDFFTHKPLTTGDWVNFAQIGVVAYLWLVLFIAYIYLPSNHSISSATKMEAIATYTIVFLVSLFPLLCDLVNPGRENDRMWFVGLFGGFHILYINWLSPVFLLLSLYFQAREMLSRPADQSLKSKWLGAQALVFGLLAVSWVFRAVFPLEWRYRGLGWGFLMMWYEMVGWAAVDYVVFAGVQAVLWGIAWRRERRGSGGLDGEGETQPLLPERATTPESADGVTTPTEREH